jgi:hypothetical protein
MVPIILIVMLSIDFAKNVVSNEDAMKKNLQVAIKRLLYAIFLFFVPTIVSFVINGLGDFDVDYKKCLNVTSDTITKQIETNKSKCTGDDYEWDDTSNECIIKANPSEIKVDIAKGSKIIQNTSSNSSSGDSTGGFTYYNQCDGWGNNCSSKTMCASGCGLTSLAIVANAFSGKNVTPSDIRDYVCANGHGGGALSSDWFSNKKLLNKYNLKSKVVVSTNNSRTYSKKRANAIKKEVEAGNGVIILIPGHYVVVGPSTQCNSSQVYLYEVGNRSNSGCYTMKALWNKTWNNKDRCTDGKTNKCGWRGAWSFSKK